MRKLLLLTLIFFNINDTLIAQMGVNTANIQGVFNIDGQKNNPTTGTPSGTQGKDDFVVLPTGQVGIGTISPHSSAMLDINVNNMASNAKKGFLPPQVALTSIYDVSTIPSPATGLLVFNTANAGVAPNDVIANKYYYYDGSKWNLQVGKDDVKSAVGVMINSYYAQGTYAQAVSQGTTADVPGVTITHVIPAGKRQQLNFLVTGYASLNPSGGSGGQGVFAIMDGGTKITSAYSMIANSGSLINLPATCTLMKTITVDNSASASALTKTYRVTFKAWAYDQIVNLNPTIYVGYDNDSECMLTKMQVQVFNLN